MEEGVVGTINTYQIIPLAKPITKETMGCTLFGSGTF
jgi:hypothetical protein